jgi:hypothetical protein
MWTMSISVCRSFRVCNTIVGYIVYALVPALSPVLVHDPYFIAKSGADDADVWKAYEEIYAQGLAKYVYS